MEVLWECLLKNGYFFLFIRLFHCFIWSLLTRWQLCPSSSKYFDHTLRSQFYQMKGEKGERTYGGRQEMFVLSSPLQSTGEQNGLCWLFLCMMDEWIKSTFSTICGFGSSKNGKFIIRNSTNNNPTERMNRGSKDIRWIDHTHFTIKSLDIFSLHFIERLALFWTERSPCVHEHCIAVRTVNRYYIIQVRLQIEKA